MMFNIKEDMHIFIYNKLKVKVEFVVIHLHLTRQNMWNIQKYVYFCCTNVISGKDAFK